MAGIILSDIIHPFLLEALFGVSSNERHAAGKKP